MLKTKLLFFPLLFLNCTLYWVKGPLPGNSNYAWSVKEIPNYSHVVYILHGAFYPGVILGDMASFGKEAVEGVFFVTENGLVFAVYNNTTRTYYPQLKIDFPQVTWASGIQHGLSRVIRIKTNEITGSIGYAYSINPDGSEADKDTVMNFIIEKINKDT